MVAKDTFDPLCGPVHEAVLSGASVLIARGGIGEETGELRVLSLLRLGDNCSLSSCLPSASADTARSFVAHMLHLQNLHYKKVQYLVRKLMERFEKEAVALNVPVVLTYELLTALTILC